MSSLESSLVGAFFWKVEGELLSWRVLDPSKDATAPPGGFLLGGFLTVTSFAEVEVGAPARYPRRTCVFVV